MRSRRSKKSMTPAMRRRVSSWRRMGKKRRLGSPISTPSSRAGCSSSPVKSCGGRMGPREEFLRHLSTERNLSPHTVRAYGGDLDRFIEFVGGEAKLLGTGIDVLLVRRFLSKLHTAAYQKSSMARMLACLRTFYDYFLRRGGID